MIDSGRFLGYDRSSLGIQVYNILRDMYVSICSISLLAVYFMSLSQNAIGSIFYHNYLELHNRQSEDVHAIPIAQAI